MNTPGSYTCHCDPGYQFDNGRCEGIENPISNTTLQSLYIATDINECSDPSRCFKNSNCVNLPGSYRCDCNSGYTLKGGQCRGTDQRIITLMSSEYEYSVTLIDRY